MTKISSLSVAPSILAIAASSFLTTSCSEQRPAEADKPKTKEKVVTGTDLSMFQNDKKAQPALPTDKVTPPVAEPESETPALQE